MTEAEFPFIRAAVTSVVNQTHPCLALMFVSCEYAKIEGVLGDLASRVQIRRVPLQPVGLIRNIGIREARTDWVAFLDGDDVWMPEKTQRQIAFAEKTKYPAVGARHLLIREDGSPFFYAFAKTQPMPASMLARRELLVEEPFGDMSCWEDADLWRRLRNRSLAVTMSEYLLHYRVRKISSSAGTAAKRRKDFFAKLSSLPAMRLTLLLVSRLLSGVLRPAQ
jgi:glycosyltransferase involved in cell wall biosynthesis